MVSGAAICPHGNTGPAHYFGARIPSKWRARPRAWDTQWLGGLVQATVHQLSCFLSAYVSNILPNSLKRTTRAEGRNIKQGRFSPMYRTLLSFRTRPAKTTSLCWMRFVLDVLLYRKKRVRRCLNLRCTFWLSRTATKIHNRRLDRPSDVP